MISLSKILQKLANNEKIFLNCEKNVMLLKMFTYLLLGSLIKNFISKKQNAKLLIQNVEKN